MRRVPRGGIEPGPRDPRRDPATGTSTRRSAAAAHPRLCRPRPCRRRPASRRCGSERASDRSVDRPRPIPSTPSSPLRRPASSRAATAIAGAPRKLSARSCAASSERTSCSSCSSPPQARRRKTSRSAAGRSSADCSSLSTWFQRSLSIRSRAGQLAIQPGFGALPLAHDGDRRHAQNFGGLVDAQAAEEAQLARSRPK